MNVRIDTSEVKKISSDMNAKIQEYRQKYNEVYTHAKEIERIWDGEARQTYMQKIEGFRNDFEAMVSVLTKYSSNLNIIAERYEKAEENAKAIAGRLSVGK